MQTQWHNASSYSHCPKCGQLVVGGQFACGHSSETTMSENPYNPNSPAGGYTTRPVYQTDWKSRALAAEAENAKLWELLLASFATVAEDGDQDLAERIKAALATPETETKEAHDE